MKDGSRELIADGQLASMEEMTERELVLVDASLSRTPHPLARLR